MNVLAVILQTLHLYLNLSACFLVFNSLARFLPVINPLNMFLRTLFVYFPTIFMKKSNVTFIITIT